jgi:hypothetical protein
VSETEFTGTHKVFLTRDYLDSPNAAMDMFEEEIVSANTGLEVDGFSRPLHSMLLRKALLATCLCLVPVLW